MVFIKHILDPNIENEGAAQNWQQPGGGKKFLKAGSCWQAQKSPKQADSTGSCGPCEIS